MDIWDGHFRRRGPLGQRLGAGTRPVGSKKSKEAGETQATGQVGSEAQGRWEHRGTVPREEGSLGHEQRKR